MSIITDRHRSVLHLRSVHRRWAREVAVALDELLAPELREDERPLDLELLQDLVIRVLDRRWRRLSQADEAMVDATDRHSALIAARDAATAELYRTVGGLRTQLTGLLGRSRASLWLGLSGETSRDPVVLLRQADRALARLGSESPPLPDDVEPPTAFDRQRWAAPLASAVSELRPLVEQATSAGKRVDAARLDRRRALKDFNASFVELADWLAATYRLIGRDDLAATVRPSKQRAGQLDRRVKRQRKKAPAGSATEPGIAARMLAYPQLRPVLRLFGQRQRSS